METLLEDLEDSDVEETNEEKQETVSSILSTPHCASILAKIQSFKNHHFNILSDSDPEYNLIIDANSISVQIDHDIINLSKLIRSIYSLKFPELEQLVPNPIEYSKAVKLIGNETDMSLVNFKQHGFPMATIMIITLTATTTKGSPLTNEKLFQLNSAIDTVMDLVDAQKSILEYVESRMTLVAPNLSAIIGTTVAAKLLALAGGLTALTKIPSCNLQVLGKTTKANIGLSAMGQQRHVGFIFYSDIVMNCAPDIRKRVAKIVAAKYINLI